MTHPLIENHFEFSEFLNLSKISSLSTQEEILENIKEQLKNYVLPNHISSHKIIKDYDEDLEQTNYHIKKSLQEQTYFDQFTISSKIIENLLTYYIEKWESNSPAPY
jgi:hypothetical protein